MIDKRIGERIKERRIELGMTQQELAEDIGYKTKSAINKIELGERSVKQDMIMPICKALNMPFTWLLGFDETEELKLTIEKLSPSKQHLVSKFIELMNQLTDDEIQEVVKHMEFTLFKRK